MKENMENKIIYIEINDWDMSFKSSSLQNIFSDLREQNLDEIYFNYAITNVDMAMVCLITTTKEDIVEYNMEELLQHEVNFKDKKSMFTHNFYRKYNPELWNLKDKNGLYFDSYEYSRSLFLLVDRNNREYMVDDNGFPFKLDEYLPVFIEDKNELKKTYDYINNDRFYKVSYGSGWCNDIEKQEINGEIINIPVFEHFINLPTGFIENYLGRKMTYEDKPVEYKLFEVNNLKIWNE